MVIKSASVPWANSCIMERASASWVMHQSHVCSPANIEMRFNIGRCYRCKIFSGTATSPKSIILIIKMKRPLMSATEAAKGLVKLASSLFFAPVWWKSSYRNSALIKLIIVHCGEFFIHEEMAQSSRDSSVLPSGRCLSKLSVACFANQAFHG